GPTCRTATYVSVCADVQESSRNRPRSARSDVQEQETQGAMARVPESGCVSRDREPTCIRYPVWRRPESAVADLEHEAGNGSSTEAADASRVRLGQSFWLSQRRQSRRWRHEGVTESAAFGRAPCGTPVRPGPGVCPTSARLRRRRGHAPRV